MSDKITPHHQSRKAILYIRQSSAHQVQHNLESQRLQYAMRDRLQQLGWRDIEVVDDDFKAQAVRLVLDEGKSVGSVARDLDLTETALREWVNRARADRTKGKTGLTTAEREELARLRRENRILQEERDILKKATAFFAKQSR